MALEAVGRSLGDSEYSGRTLKDVSRVTWSDSYVWRMDRKKAWLELWKLVGIEVFAQVREISGSGGGRNEGFGMYFGRGLMIGRERDCEGQEKGKNDHLISGFRKSDGRQC